jgi:hypothetical protein
MTTIAVLALSLLSSIPVLGAAAADPVAKDSKVYIEPTDNGMHTALAGALRKKKVPLVVVVDKEKADYVISVVGEYKKSGWAKTLMSGGNNRGEANASMTVVHRESGVVAYGYNVDKGNVARGMQSVAEACAKHLGNHIAGKE